jgi:hypothetical protein
MLASCWRQLEEMRKNEDPRLSFSTPEFKEAQRIFTGGLKVIGIDPTVWQHRSFRRAHALPRAHGLIEAEAHCRCHRTHHPGGQCSSTHPSAGELLQASGVGAHQRPCMVHAAAQKTRDAGEPPAVLGRAEACLVLQNVAADAHAMLLHRWTWMASHGLWMQRANPY